MLPKSERLEAPRGERREGGARVGLGCSGCGFECRNGIHYLGWVNRPGSMEECYMYCAINRCEKKKKTKIGGEKKERQRCSSSPYCFSPLLTCAWRREREVALRIILPIPTPFIPVRSLSFPTLSL